MNAQPYVVFFHYYGDRFGEKRFATFEEACKQLKKYEAMEAVEPRGYPIELHNEDGYDIDCSDGLTREERDIVWSREYAEERCAS